MTTLEAELTRKIGAKKMGALKEGLTALVRVFEAERDEFSERG